VSPYGCAKLSIEKYLHFYRVVHGFEVQVLRYANVYGPGQNGLGEAGVVAIFAEAILAGRIPKIRGDGEQTRDYVFVADVVETAARALASGKSGTWNVGTGVETSVNRLFELLAPALGFRGKPEYVPLAPGEQRRSVLDGSAARRDLGVPPWTPIETGIPVTAEAFRRAKENAAR
jgi:UDP-glucose 4-epimerase